MKEITKEQAYAELKYGGTVYFVRDGQKYKLTVSQDELAESPRDWVHLGTIVSPKGDWDIADCDADDLSLCREEYKEQVESLKNKEDVYMKPIYMLDHSGQTISLTDFKDPWDSGVCGCIFATKQDVFDYFGEEAGEKVTEENWKDFAQEAFEAEIEVYNYFFTGEVYAYQLSIEAQIKHENVKSGKVWYTNEYEEVDGCAGFYGPDMVKNDLIDMVQLQGNEVFYLEN